MANKGIKKHYRKQQDVLGKAIDDTATGLTNVASGLIGGLFSAAAESVKDSLFKDDNDD